MKKVIDDVGIFLGVECSLGNPLSRFLINRFSKKNNGASLLEERCRTTVDYTNPLSRED